MNAHASISPQSKYVDLKFIAALFGYKQQTIRKWLYLDKLPKGFPRPEKVNTRNMWLRKHVEEYFAKLDSLDQGLAY